MESNVKNAIPSLLSQLRPFITDDSVFGRLHADLQDILDASSWLLKTFSDLDQRVISASELENLLVDIEVKFVEHVSFHFETLRGDLKSTLKQFPTNE